MKKLMKSLMLFAAAAMALTSCENEAMNDGIDTNETYTMTFVADAPQSRTAVNIDGKNANFSWSAGDKVGFYKVANGVASSVSKAKQKANSSSITIADDGTAKFSVSFDAAVGATDYNIAAFYPGNSWGGSHADENPFKNVEVKLPSAQALTADSFDPAADLMMSKPHMGVALNDDSYKTLEFTRLVAIGCMNLKGVAAGETITSVTIEFPNHTMNGEAVLDMENGVANLGTNNTTNSVVLTGELTAEETSTPIFFTCFPGDYSGTYNVTVKTQTPANETATYTKTSTIDAAKALKFTAGNVLGFNLTVGNKVTVQNLPELDNTKRYLFTKATEFVGGKWYAIVASNVAATAITSGTYGYLYTVAPITVGENISLPATSAFGFLSAAGGYTIQQNDGKYLYLKGDYSSFNVEAAPTEGHVFTVDMDDTATITNVLNEKSIQYSTSYGSFGAYATTTGVFPNLYVLAGEDTGSHLLGVSTNELSFVGAGETIALTVNTYGEGDITATANNDWLSVAVDQANKSVAVTAKAATEAREGSITVSFAGKSETITVSQAAPMAEGQTVTATITFDNTSKRTEYTTEKQVWVENGITVTNNKSDSTTDVGNYSKPARFYKNSEVIVAVAGGNITQIVFNVNGDKADYLSAMESSVEGEVVSGNAVTITLAGTSNSYTFTTSGGQVRMDSITVTYTTGSGGDVVETLATPANVEAIADGKDVLIAWDEVANATSYYVTCGDQSTTVTATEAEFTMPNYSDDYNITVVAKADGYNDSVAATTTVTTEADPNAGETTKYYVKVTEAPADWSGKYLIVYGNLALNGGLTSTLDAVGNSVSVTIAGNKIEATNAMNAAAFTVATYSTGYSFLGAGKLYMGQTSNANGLKSSATQKYVNTLSINADESVNIVSGGAYLRYNSASNQLRFRYYKSSSYTGQQAIYLYKLED